MEVLYLVATALLGVVERAVSLGCKSGDTHNRHMSRLLYKFSCACHHPRLVEK